MPGSTGSGGTGSDSSKVCTKCGVDVSFKPRTKDARGRYFCKPCYEAAIAGKHAERKGTPLPKAAPIRNSAGSLLSDDPIGLEADDGEVNTVLANLLGDMAAHDAPGMICPSCRTQLQPGGFICTKCGFNLQTNERAGAVKVKIQRAAGGAVWPPMVGITSIVLGAGGVLFYGAYFAMAVLASVQTGNLGRGMVTIIPVGSLLTGLAAWLLRDGVRILRRDSEGVKWIRYWALAKGLIFGSCLGLMMAIPPGDLEQALAAAPGATNLTVTEIKSTILLSLLFYLAWPIFVLVFFFIPRIHNDVEAWD